LQAYPVALLVIRLWTTLVLGVRVRCVDNVLTVLNGVRSVLVELIRFRGDFGAWKGEVHDAEDMTAVSAGVSAADGGTGRGWANTA